MGDAMGFFEVLFTMASQQKVGVAKRIYAYVYDVDFNLNSPI